MPAEVGEGKVKITPDTAGFGDDLDRQISSEGSRASGTMGRLGDMAGAAFRVAAAAAVAGAVAIAGGAAYAIGQASDLSESLSKNSAVFQDQAGEIEAWARTASTAFGQSTTQALGAATAYGNLFQAFGVGRSEAAEMSTSLTELAADLASFNNTSIDEALGALQSGITGETEPLKRYGVVINEVRLQQEALALGLISSVDEALTPAAKAQASYSLIMKDTALAQGDFARTSDGMANQQRILKAQLTDLAAAVGTALLPIVTRLAGFLIENVIPALSEFGAWLAERLPGAIDAVVGFLTPMVEWIRDRIPAALEIGRAAFEGLVNVIETVVSFISDNWQVVLGAVTGLGIAILASLVPGFIAWATAAGAAAIATIAAAAPVILVGALLVALGAAVVYAYREFEGFRNVVDTVARFFTDTLWPALQSVFGWLRDNVPPILQAVAEWFVDVWNRSEGFRAFLVDALQAALSLIVDAFGFVVDAITTLWDWVQTVWDRSEGFRGFLVDAFAVALEVARVAIDVVWTALSTLIDWVQSAWTASEGFRIAMGGVFSAGMSLAGAAVDLVWSALSLVVTWVGNAWMATEGIRDFLAGVFSTGVGIASAAVEAVWKAFESVVSWVGDAWDATEGIREFLAGVFSTGIGIAVDAVGGLIGAFESILGFLEDIISTAQTAVDWLGRVTSGQVLSNIGTGVLAQLPGQTGGGTGTIGRTNPPAAGGASVGFRSHEGGIVPGLSGDEVAMTLRAGEAVFTPQQMRALGSVIAGTANANRDRLSGPITLIIEGTPFTAMIADYDERTAQMIGAGVR